MVAHIFKVGDVVLLDHNIAVAVLGTSIVTVYCVEEDQDWRDPIMTVTSIIQNKSWRIQIDQASIVWRDEWLQK